MSEPNQKEVNEQMYLLVKRWLDNLSLEEGRKVPVRTISYCLAKLKEQEEEIENLKQTAQSMMEEQEAKEVKKLTNMYTGLPITHCPKCGVSLDKYLYGRQHEGQINYCPKCGQAVAGMDKEDIIRRLKKISEHAIHVTGEPPFIMSLDDGIALDEAVRLLKEQEAIKPDVDSEGTCSCGNCGTTVGYYPAGCSVPEKLCKHCPECGYEVKWE